MSKKEQILVIFADINYKYNDCTAKNTLEKMLNEMEEEIESSFEPCDKNVLYKLRSEIEHLHDWAFSRAWVLRIIDNYIEGSNNI